VFDSLTFTAVIGPSVCYGIFLDDQLDCIIEALGNPQKERMKHEDTNISHWLQGNSQETAVTGGES